MASQKQIHSLVVDTGPLIKNTISISTIVQSAENIYTTPAILSEIRDKATRARVETTLLPFLTVRNPSPASYEHVAQFSKKTGDFAVLSRQDLGILALAYEIDQEIRKRKENEDGREMEPTDNAQKEPDVESHSTADQNACLDLKVESVSVDEVRIAGNNVTEKELDPTEAAQNAVQPEVLSEGGVSLDKTAQESTTVLEDSKTSTEDQTASSVEVSEIASVQVEEPGKVEASSEKTPTAPVEDSLAEGISNLDVSPQPSSEPEEEDDGGEWITPKNLKKHQAKDSGVHLKETEPQQISVATMTSDYAMQNVILQMKLALISPSMQRIRNLRSYILRCHACFLTTKEMDKQFCPRCGQPTLQRVSCSTNAKGEFRVHLSKNYQWNNRGNRFSVPKLSAGTASGRNVKGGGKGGWGNDLILAADQKEYMNGIKQQKRMQSRDLMDDDYLPGILTGDRARDGGRPKVGAGRNVNSRKFTK